MRKFLSRSLILLGIICYIFVGYGFIERTQPRRVSFAYAQKLVAENPSSPKKLANPTYIEIPSLYIALPIFPAKIINGEWEATTQGVSYLVHSPVPGEYGNSILYGHNWTNLLGSLPNIKIGDKIIITNAEKKKLTFEVQYTALVTPDEVSILQPSKDNRITLYTCTGFLDSHRFVVVGILKK